MIAEGLVVVGGSYAAMQVASSAREAGYAGPIRIVSEERDAPYHRPPLSKTFLVGKVAEKSLPLRGSSFYRDNELDLVLNSQVTGVQRRERQLELADGSTIRYDHLALATGARPRTLNVEGADLDGVLAIRSLTDARALKDRLGSIGSVVVIGAGFIGLEAASALATMGKSVTVLESLSRVLMRGAAEPLASYVAELHRRKGVNLLTDRTVTSIEGAHKRVTAVVDNRGVKHQADAVVVGIGVLPNVELAANCGLPCSNGIRVNRYAVTADPIVVAAGDCTSHPNMHCGGDWLRLESVQNALDQGKTAGAYLVGSAVPYDAVPWFWSDQYDAKFQMVGLSGRHDSFSIRGDVSSGRFSIFYFQKENICAIDSINRPAEHMIGRKLLASKVRLSPAQAADLSFDIGGTL